MHTAKRVRRQIGAYRVAVRVSRNARILVEGADDRNILVRLINLLAKSGRISERVDIDTAQDLDSLPDQTLSNREKVELVCSGLIQPDIKRFAGFVDREFRGFDLTSFVVSDDVGGHFLSGRLLWSRGHSIENYLLSFPVLSYAIQHYSESSACYEALRRLEPVYPDVMRLACAVSLASAQHHRLEAIRDCIRWNELRFEPSVTFDEVDWTDHIASKHSQLDANELYSDIRGWYDRLASSDVATMQWLSDGHIGLAISLAAYQRAVFEVTGANAREAEKSLNVKRKTCALGGAIKWAEMACAGQTEWPEELVQLLSA